jgi:hypothetical protein
MPKSIMGIERASFVSDNTSKSPRILPNVKAT